MAVIVTLDTNRTTLLPFTAGAATTWLDMSLWLFAIVGIIGIGTGFVLAAANMLRRR